MINDLLTTLTETSNLRQDEWPTRGDIKWSEHNWNPGQRCSDLGETLDSGGDAAERCQLVLGGRHRGEPETVLAQMTVETDSVTCKLFLYNFPFNPFHSSSSSSKTSPRECCQRRTRLRSSWTVSSVIPRPQTAACTPSSTIFSCCPTRSS